MMASGNQFISGPIASPFMAPNPPPGVTQGAAAAISGALGGAVGGMGGGVIGGPVSTYGTTVGAPVGSIAGGIVGGNYGGVGSLGGVGVGLTPVTTNIATTTLRNSQVLGTRTGSPIPGPTATFQGRVGPSTVTAHSYGAAYSPPHASLVAAQPVVSTGVVSTGVVPATTTVVRTSRAISPGFVAPASVIGGQTVTSGIMGSVIGAPTVVSGIRQSRTIGATVVAPAVPVGLPPVGVMNSGFGGVINAPVTTVVTDTYNSGLRGGYGTNISGIGATIVPTEIVTPVEKSVTVVETVTTPTIAPMTPLTNSGIHTVQPMTMTGSITGTGTPLSGPPVGLIAPVTDPGLMGAGLAGVGYGVGPCAQCCGPVGPCAQCCGPMTPCYPYCNGSRRICGLPWWIPLILLLLGLSALGVGLSQYFGGSTTTTDVKKPDAGDQTTNQTTTDQTTTNQTTTNQTDTQTTQVEKNETSSQQGSQATNEPGSKNSSLSTVTNIVTTKTLTCEEGFFSYKGRCITCPEGARWNGKNCVRKTVVNVSTNPGKALEASTSSTTTTSTT